MRNVMPPPGRPAFSTTTAVMTSRARATYAAVPGDVVPFVGGSHRPVTPARHRGDRYFGATAFDGSEWRPVPFAFVAATVNV